VALDLASEVLVFVQLRRVSRSGWAVRGKRVFQPLREIFPILVPGRGVVAFLRRHEHLWINVFKLLGREVTERYEMGLQELREYVEETVETVRETIRSTARNTALADLPQWLIEELVTIRFGRLPHTSILEFIENVEEKFREYMEAPLVLRGLKRAETRFQKLLSTSQIMALKVRRCRFEELMDVKLHLYQLLEKGVIPVDFSKDSIIVAKKIQRHKGSERFWLSTLNLDPAGVLRGLESECVTVEDARELEFESRDVGWGLRVAQTYPGRA